MKRKPFANFSAIAAPLPLANINTDAIIPAPYLRTADADLAQGLFARWRYNDKGDEIADFILNRPGFRTAGVILGGENFGCGSSREAAVWALLRSGVKAVLAPAFADIFYENAFRNGLLAGIVTAETLAHLLALIGDDPQRASLHVDLARRTVTGNDGRALNFLVPDFRRDALLRGDDEIAATLRHVSDIDDFIKADALRRPWIHETGLTP